MTHTNVLVSFIEKNLKSKNRKERKKMLMYRRIQRFKKQID